MEIICECGHRLKDHDESQCGCWYHYFGGSCYCNLLPETVEARYWAQYMKKERDRLKIILYDEGVELRKTRNHYVQACVQRDEIKRKMLNENDAFQTKLDEKKEQLRMCQLALKTADLANAELASYTKIAVDAIKKALQSGIWMHEYPSNTAVYNDLEEALDKIKGKF